MSDILKTIVEQKRIEVAELRVRGLQCRSRTQPRRPFSAALRRLPAMALIAEVKKASPSRGILRPDFDPVAIAQAYEQAGADALSVLTDRQFFQGSNEFLLLIRADTGIPVLRKEFIIDPLQVEESAGLNADAMLLIAAILSDAQLKDLFMAARELDIEPLIEVHSRAELDRALTLSPEMVGINNRDLKTFKTDMAMTLELIKFIPPGIIVISESGIVSGDHTRRLLDAGVSAVLAGESLVTLADPRPRIEELRHARKN
jgi:indole-3-glycerol phosphate synthase